LLLFGTAKTFKEFALSEGHPNLFVRRFLKIRTKKGEYTARGPWNWDYPEIGLEIRKNTPASWGVLF